MLKQETYKEMNTSIFWCHEKVRQFLLNLTEHWRILYTRDIKTLCFTLEGMKEGYLKICMEDSDFAKGGVQ